MSRKEDPRRFEKTREVREARTRSVREEASEEDRRQWEETRDIDREASEAPEEAHDRPPTENPERERPEE